MASVNKVILLGNCGKDPEVRNLPSGQLVVSVSIATSTKRKDKNNGQTVEDTQWHRVSFYDRLAEIAAEYLKKGRPVYVEGRIKYGKYTDQAGIERNTVDIIGLELQLLGSGSGVDAQASNPVQSLSNQNSNSNRQPLKSVPIPISHDRDFVDADSVPF